MAESNLYHDENTMRKVFMALIKSGLTSDEANDAVMFMQNAGILFREKRPEDG
jgi:hypothetical protein